MRTRRKVAGTAAANLVLTAASALIGLFVARELGAEARGVFAATFAWFGLVLALGEMGTSSAITFLISREPERRQAILRDGRLVFLVLGGASGLLLVSFSFVLAADQPDYRGALIAFGLFTPMAFQVGIPSFALQALSINRWNSARLTHPVAYLALLIGLDAAERLDLWGVIFAYCVSSSVTLMVSYALLAGSRTAVDPWLLETENGVPSAELDPNIELDSRPAASPPSSPSAASPSGRYIRTIVEYGLRNFSSSIPNAVSMRLDLIVLSFFVADAQLGEFAVATTLASLAMPAAMAFANLALPQMAATEGVLPLATVRSLSRRSLIGSFVVAAIASVLIAVVAPRAAVVILGPDYPTAGLLAAVLCVAQPARAVALVGRNILRGLNAPGAAALPEWGGLALLGILLLAFVPGLGIWGGAAAAVSASWGLAAMYMMAISRQFRARQGDEPIRVP